MSAIVTGADNFPVHAGLAATDVALLSVVVPSGSLLRASNWDPTVYVRLRSRWLADLLQFRVASGCGQGRSPLPYPRTGIMHSFRETHQGGILS